MEETDQSSLCRLCGSLNQNGTYIFSEEGNGSNLCSLINKYLPLKVENNGEYPDKICPGCEIQLEATKLFFDLIIEGQKQLKLIFAKIKEAQLPQLDNLQNISSKVGAFEIHSVTGEKYFIQIMDNSTQEGPLFSTDHEIMKSIHDITKVKKKRGRPRKQVSEIASGENTADLESNTEKELANTSISDDRKRRRRLPRRFFGTVQGEELDNILRKEGIEDGYFRSEESDLKEGQIIGRIESQSGEEQTQQIIIMKNLRGMKYNQQRFSRSIKRRKYKCDKCSEVFRNYQRLRIHKEASHKNEFQTNNSNIDTNSETATEYLDEDPVHINERNVDNSEAFGVNSKNPTTIKTIDPINNENIPVLLSNDQTCEENNGNIDESFICNQCKKTFSSMQNLNMHIEEEHEKKKPYPCPDCEQTFFYAKRFRMHQLKHQRGVLPCEPTTIETSKPIINNENISKSSNDQTCEEDNGNIKESFICNQCNTTFSSMKNFKMHIEEEHEEKKPFTCPLCKQTFSYAKSFRMHQLKHKRGVLTCEVCQKKFNHPSSLHYHRSTEHNNGRRFLCNKCNKTFKNRQLLQRHQVVHSEQRPFKCNYCSAAFKARPNLQSHRVVHTGERGYGCTECDQTFVHKTSLTHHMRWHLGEKPFSCDICKKNFSQKGNLIEHRRIHTGEKPFCCDQCSRKFTTSSQLKLHKKRHIEESVWDGDQSIRKFTTSQLKLHKKRHTGESLWECEVCSKSFLHKDTWRDHCKRHLNKCHVCSESFTSLFFLRKHIRTHIGKQHSCDICGKTFSDMTQLVKHRKTHQETFSNQNETQLPLPNTGDDNNLFYVYLEASKDANVPQSLVHLESQPKSEVVVSTEQHSVAFKEEPMQFQQVVDQEGNPLSLNMQDGQQINVVTSITNGQEKLQGLLPDGTLVAIDLHDCKVESMERLVDHVEEETSVSHLLLDGSMTFLNDGIMKPESDILVTEQPNLCFVTYDPNTGNIE